MLKKRRSHQTKMTHRQKRQTIQLGKECVTITM